MRVVVVAGGPSSEAEVSRASARGVLGALSESGHEACIEELDADLPAAIARVRPEVVFPVTHGTLGEDGCLQGLLEVLGLPYVGSGVLASALSTDKVVAKDVLRVNGVPVARGTHVSRTNAPEGKGDLSRRLERLREELGAFVIKPASGGSAIGVTRVQLADPVDVFRRGLERSFEFDTVAVCEALWSGVEITCGVLESDAGEPEALPPTLIEAQKADFYDFQSKYAIGGSVHHCPAPLARELTEAIQSTAVRAHRALGARDLSRVDFIVADSGDFVVLELNTLPGMTKTSLFPEAAAAAGIAFPELCDRLVRRAAARPSRLVPFSMPMPV